MENLISNGKLFIDFGETEGGSGGGALWMRFATNLKQSTMQSVEVKKAMGTKGGIGFIYKGGGGTLTLTELRHAPAMLSWQKLIRDKKKFTLAYQDDDEDGTRQRWLTCTVSKMDPSHDEDGNHTNEVEIAYLETEERE